MPRFSPSHRQKGASGFRAARGAGTIRGPATRAVMPNPIPLLSGLAVLLSSCALQDVYGREYVLYDDSGPPATAAAPSSGPERVFELERQAAELRAASAAGLDGDGRIAARLAGLDAEIAALAEALGQSLVEARTRRVEQLLGSR